MTDINQANPGEETTRSEGMLLHMLGRAPLLDRLALSSLCGISSTRCHDHLELMEKEALDHGTSHLRIARRHFLTERGLKRLRSIVGGSLRNEYPLSRAWREAFSQRMDPVASIYRFAASLAVESGMSPVYVNYGGPLCGLLVGQVAAGIPGRAARGYLR